MSTTEKALKAKADADALIQNAIKEQLEIIRDANNALKELGYKATGGESSGGGKKATAKKTRNTDPAKKHCPICNMDGHDGRAHRAQGKKKKKFTADELKKLGLS